MAFILKSFLNYITKLKTHLASYFLSPWKKVYCLMIGNMPMSNPFIKNVAKRHQIITDQLVSQAFVVKSMKEY